MFTKELILQNHEAQVQVNLKKSSRAKRIILRISQNSGVELVVPKRASEKAAMRFLYNHQEWLFNKLSQVRPALKNELKDGAKINISGREYIICHTGNLRGITTLNDNILSVSGEQKFINKKVKDFLKSEAKREISKIAAEHHKNMGVKYQNITLRDTTSRWGSCSQNGNLSFSWRLIFAPYEVLRYVVIHELAHLREMNHSKNFWDIVAKFDANYKQHRKWLKANGKLLHSYD